MTDRAPSELERRLAVFRGQLLARDEAALRATAAAFGRVVAVLEAEVAALTRQLAQDGLLAGGLSEEAARGKLARLRRYKALLAQADEELARLLPGVERAIRAEQLALVRAGAAHAEALVAAAAGLGPETALVAGFRRLPVGAIAELVGATQAGAPLAEVLARYGDDAARAIGDELVAGMARGSSPDEVARLIRNRLVAIGGGTDAAGAPRLGRLQTTVRTSLIGAYRRASVLTLQENEDLVGQWRWTCAKSARTCLNCVARDGELWPVADFIPAHPNCRCTVVPVLRGGGPSPLETGAEWFARQPAGVRRRILGPSAFDAMERGEIALSDFKGYRDDPTWGPTTYQRSLAEIRRDGRRRAA